MENNSVKRDNRKALPKYLLILFLAAVFGGVIGFLSGWMGHDSLSGTVEAAITGFLTDIAPWAIPVTSVVSLSLVLWLYRSARVLFTTWDGEDDEVMDQAEEKLNWALLLTTSQMILDMFFFAAAGTYSSPVGGLVSVLFFVVSVFSLVFAQQKIVDLTRRMNPEKQGSVYDLRFKKKWFESCDEAERRQIGQAAYKAFNVANTACPILWMVLIIVSFAFNRGILLPAFSVCLIWLLLNVTYCVEAIRLRRRK